MAVMHHGGAGTTSCGLRHGRPTAIISWFGDQPLWGASCEAAGAGSAPLSAACLSRRRLVRAIQVLLKPETQAAAQRLALRLRAEDGASAATEAILQQAAGLGMLVPQGAAPHDWQLGNRSAECHQALEAAGRVEWARLRTNLGAAAAVRAQRAPVRPSGMVGGSAAAGVGTAGVAAVAV